MLDGGLGYQHGCRAVVVRASLHLVPAARMQLRGDLTLPNQPHECDMRRHPRDAPVLAHAPRTAGYPGRAPAAARPAGRGRWLAPARASGLVTCVCDTLSSGRTTSVSGAAAEI